VLRYGTKATEKNPESYENTGKKHMLRRNGTANHSEYPTLLTLLKAL